MGQDELARRNGYVRKTVLLIENHVEATMDSRRYEVLEALAAYLESQGIEFLRPKDGKGGGVRFANGKREPQIVDEVRDLIEERRGKSKKMATSEKPQTKLKAKAGKKALKRQLA